MCGGSSLAGEPERQLTLRQADQARADFAGILDELECLKWQLAQVPSRAWLGRMALLGFGRDARSQHLPSLEEPGDAFDLKGAEIAVLEELTHQPACACPDDDRTRLGQGLQPCGEVWGLADDRLLLRRALADQIAYHDQPGGDPDARLQLPD
jgi:hypothetical protein